MLKVHIYQATRLPTNISIQAFAPKIIQLNYQFYFISFY
jgi:hypothetical protein